MGRFLVRAKSVNAVRKALGASPGRGVRVIGRFDRETIECVHTMEAHSLSTTLAGRRSAGSARRGSRWFSRPSSERGPDSDDDPILSEPAMADPNDQRRSRDRLARRRSAGGGRGCRRPRWRGRCPGPRTWWRRCRRGGRGRRPGRRRCGRWSRRSRRRGCRRRRRGRCSSCGQWSRPSGPNCVVLVTFGVRPNSPIQTIRVSSSRPRDGEVVDQGRHGLVGGGQEAVLELVEVVAVRVPAAGALAADGLRVVDGDEPDAGLDQAAGQQAALAVGGPAVGVAELAGPRATGRRPP